MDHIINNGDGAVYNDIHKELVINGPVTDKQLAAILAMLQKDSNAPKEETETTTSDQELISHHIIPQQCVEAAAKVFTNYILSKSGEQISVRKRIVLAANLIDRNRPTDIGLMLMVCREANAVISSCSNIDFVRGLVGLGVLKVFQEKEMERISDGFRLKVNNLDPKHINWPNNQERALGDDIFNALTR